VDYCPTVIDTGTSIIVGPSYLVDPLIKAVGTVNKDCSNIKSLPTLAFTFNPPLAQRRAGLGTTLPLTPDYYVLRVETKRGVECVLGIEAADAVAPFLILGDPFLRAYYSVYDAAHFQISFAPAVQPTPHAIIRATKEDE